MGYIVTINAMGCQKSIARAIFYKGADNLLMVKGNQKYIKNQVEKLFSIAPLKTQFSSNDLGHGRIERWKCEVVDQLRFLNGKKEWAGLKTLISITSERTNKRAGSGNTETRFYISSLEPDAKLINNAVRSHWAVENNLQLKASLELANAGLVLVSIYGREKLLKGSISIFVPSRWYRCKLHINPLCCVLCWLNTTSRSKWTGCINCYNFFLAWGGSLYLFSDNFENLDEAHSIGFYEFTKIIPLLFWVMDFRWRKHLLRGSERENIISRFFNSTKFQPWHWLKNYLHTNCFPWYVPVEYRIINTECRISNDEHQM